MERQPLLPFEESTEVIEVLKKSGLLAQLQTEALERLKDDVSVLKMARGCN